jgi:rRNA maturation RNase YbeY
MSSVSFQGLPPEVEEKELHKWLFAVADEYDRRIGKLTYSFISDEEILMINRSYLQHDYFTDIITFDYNTRSGVIKGEVYVSLDTVKSNALKLKLPYREELLRVVVHGLLHLIGFGDKSPEEQRIMRKQEDFCLLLRPKKLKEIGFT